MLLYIVLFGFMVWCSFVELFSKQSKALGRHNKHIIFLILIVLTTIRGGTYGDYQSYQFFYEYYVNTQNFFATTNFHFEPLYSILQFICKCLVDNFQFFIFIIGLLVLIVQAKYASTFKLKDEEEEGRYYATIMLVLWCLYYCNIFVIRSTVSAVLCLYSLNFIEKKNLKKFVLCVLVAIGFHYSAFVFLPAYFIYHYHSSISKKVAIFVGGSILGILFIERFSMLVGKIIGGEIGTKVLNYLSGDLSFGIGNSTAYSVSTIIIKAVINIGVLLVIGIYAYLINKDNPRIEGFLNLYIVGSILYIASLMVGVSFARLSVYYNMVQVPMLMALVKKRNYLTIQYWGLIVCYLAVRYFVNLNGSPIVPFITFWQ